MCRTWLTILCTAAIAACNYDGQIVDPQPGEEVTLSLVRGQDGTLRFCEVDSDCVDGLPNPNDCAVLEIKIDTTTGETCERCLNASADVIVESCSGSSVACAIITIPEPDCVVCAYVNGAVIFSSC